MSVVTTALPLIATDASFVTRIGLFVTKDVYLAVTAGLCLSKAIALAGRVVSFVTSFTVVVYVAINGGLPELKVPHLSHFDGGYLRSKVIYWPGARGAGIMGLNWLRSVMTRLT